MSPSERDCARCAHATRHRSWGPPWEVTHCRECHRDWRMSSPQCHCTLCCAHFSNHRAADLHMTATGCRPLAEVVSKRGEQRLMLRQDRYGPIWRLAGRNPWARGTSKILGALQPSAPRPPKADAGPDDRCPGALWRAGKGGGVSAERWQLFPDLTPEEYEALTADIAAHGLPVAHSRGRGIGPDRGRPPSPASPGRTALGRDQGRRLPGRAGFCRRRRAGGLRARSQPVPPPP